MLNLSMSLQVAVTPEKPDPLVVLVLPKMPCGEPDYMEHIGKKFAAQFGCKFIELSQTNEGLACWRLEMSEEQAVAIGNHPQVEEAYFDFENPQVRGWYHRVYDAVKAPFSRDNV